MRLFELKLVNVCTKISQKMQDLIRLSMILYSVISKTNLVESFFLVCRDHLDSICFDIIRSNWVKCFNVDRKFKMVLPYNIHNLKFRKLV